MYALGVVCFVGIFCWWWWQLSFPDRGARHNTQAVRRWWHKKPFDRRKMTLRDKAMEMGRVYFYAGAFFIVIFLLALHNAKQ